MQKCVFSIDKPALQVERVYYQHRSCSKRIPSLVNYCYSMGEYVSIGERVNNCNYARCIVLITCVFFTEPCK